MLMKKIKGLFMALILLLIASELDKGTSITFELPIEGGE